MQTAVPLACFLSMIRPPGVQYENALLQIAPVHKSKCPFVRDGNDIGFQLYTRHNPTVNQDLVLGDDEKLFASNMNFADSTVIYFHAFMEQPDDGSAIMVREAYMQRGDTNVIMVDAQRLEAGPWYFTAAQNTWYIGRFTALFVDYLVTRGLNLNNTHFVGHSLGAQAAGVAGASLTTGRVSRITGLDPALPLFSHLPLEQRLDESDAEFVDVIHTDAGIFGFKAPVGHVDFYPNGGKSPQPGCELEVVIPQQLLLNKCNGSEKTAGFYTYYLTTDNEKVKAGTKVESDSPNSFTTQMQNKAIEKHRRIRNTGAEEDLRQSKAHHGSIKNYFTKEFDKESNKSTQNRHTIKLKRHNNEEDVETTDTFIIKASGKVTNHDKVNLTTQENESQYKTTSKEFTNTMIEKYDKSNLKTEQNGHNARSNEKYTTNLNKFKPHNTKAKIQLEKIRDDDTLPKMITQLMNLLNAQRVPKLLIGKVLNRATETTKTHRHKRQKRFLDFLRRDNGNNDNNFILNALGVLKNRRGVLPVFSVVREINTLVKSQNGELSHVIKEINNIIGGAAPVLDPVKFTLELGNESRVKAFVKRLLGLSPTGDRLTVGN